MTIDFTLIIDITNPMKHDRLMFKEKKLCGLFVGTVLGGNKLKTLESIRRMCGRFLMRTWDLKGEA